MQAKQRSFGEELLLIFSASRRQKFQQRVETLRLRIAACRTEASEIEEKIRRIHDVWPTYPPDWSDRRKLVLQRDGNWCAECGADEMLHMHHRRSIKEGGTHNIDNLVLLCEECHSQEHGGRRFKYRLKSEESYSSKAVAMRITLINEALVAKKDIRIRYRKRDGSTTSRKVTPRELRKLRPDELRKLTKQLGIKSKAQKEGRLCLFGYCHLRHENRTFAIDRIQKLQIE